MNWPSINSTQIRNWILLIDNTITWSPSLFFISNRFYKTQKRIWSIERSHHYGIVMGCHLGTGRAQYWHLAVTCNITVAIVKTIEIMAYLLYQTTQINPRALQYERVVKMTQMAYSGLFWAQFRVSSDLFTDLTARKAAVRPILPRLLTAASRIQNCTYRKIITHQTSQSSLPNVGLWLTGTQLNSNEIWIIKKTIVFIKLNLECNLQNNGHFAQASMF